MTAFASAIVTPRSDGSTAAERSTSTMTLLLSVLLSAALSVSGDALREEAADELASDVSSEVEDERWTSPSRPHISSKAGIQGTHTSERARTLAAGDTLGCPRRDSVIPSIVVSCKNSYCVGI